VAENRAGGPRRDNQKVIEKTIRMGGKLFVAETQEGILAGTSWMTFDGRRIHLHHLGILPALQRKGIGKLLTVGFTRGYYYSTSSR
jgi:[ribosomal protein S18]-alanine N-acetyltransferase